MHCRSYLKSVIAGALSAALVLSPIASAEAQSLRKSTTKPSTTRKPMPPPKYAPIGSAYEAGKIKVRDRVFAVKLRMDKSGRPMEQMLITKDREELQLDTNGDGTLDHWEVRTRDTHVELNTPSGGMFHVMEVKHRLPQGVMEMRFAIDSRTNQYQLVRYQLAKPRTHFGLLQDLVVGCAVEGYDVQLAKFAQDAADKIRAADNALQKYRQTIASDLVQDACKKPPFDKSTDSIVDGIMKVLQSDVANTAGIPKEKGTFLQCLRHFEMPVPANRILTGLANFDGDTDPQSRYQWRVTCAKPPPRPANGAKYTDTQVRDIQSGRVKADDPYLLDPIAKFDGDISGQPPTVTLMKTKDECAAHNGGDAVQGYASTFFHEMLHYAGLKDHDYVTPLQNCCSQPGNHSDCAKVKAFVQQRKVAQAVQNIARNHIPDYEKRIGLIADAMGSDSGQTIDNFYNDIGRSYIELCGAPSEKTGEKLPPHCRERFKQRVAKTIRDHFGENGFCERNALGSMADPKACYHFGSVMSVLAGSATDEVKVAATCKKISTLRLPTGSGGFIAIALTPSTAHATDTDYRNLICIPQGTTVDWDNVNASPAGPVPSFFMDPKMIVQPGTDTGPGVVTKPEGNHTPFDPPPQVRPQPKPQPKPVPIAERPPVPLPSKREEEIVKHLERADGVVSRSKAIAEALAKTAVPQAQAATEPLSSDRSRTTLSQNGPESVASRTRASDFRVADLLRGPQFSAPNPFLAGALAATGSDRNPQRGANPAYASAAPIGERDSSATTRVTAPRGPSSAGPGGGRGGSRRRT